MVRDRDEFRWLQPASHAVKQKEQERERIARETEEFLERGGKIQGFGVAESGWAGKKFDLGFRLALGQNSIRRGGT